MCYNIRYIGESKKSIYLQDHMNETHLVEIPARVHRTRLLPPPVSKVRDRARGQGRDGGDFRTANTREVWGRPFTQRMRTGETVDNEQKF
jgi:hypothetical protein